MTQTQYDYIWLKPNRTLPLPRFYYWFSVIWPCHTSISSFSLEFSPGWFVKPGTVAAILFIYSLRKNHTHEGKQMKRKLLEATQAHNTFWLTNMGPTLSMLFKIISAGFSDAADSVIFICCVSIFNNFEPSPNKIWISQIPTTPLKHKQDTLAFPFSTEVHHNFTFF